MWIELEGIRGGEIGVGLKVVRALGRWVELKGLGGEIGVWLMEVRGF